jgi:hypothetical protein
MGRKAATAEASPTSMGVLLKWWDKCSEMYSRAEIPGPQKSAAGGKGALFPEKILFFLKKMRKHFVTSKICPTFALANGNKEMACHSSFSQAQSDGV